MMGVYLAEDGLRLTPYEGGSGDGYDDMGGLDVHARSTEAAAIDVLGGELSRQRFAAPVGLQADGASVPA
jgi:hypothetical protein